MSMNLAGMPGKYVGSNGPNCVLPAIFICLKANCLSRIKAVILAVTLTGAPLSVVPNAKSTLSANGAADNVTLSGPMATGAIPS